MDVQVALEENNFSQAKGTVETVQLQHPLVYDHLWPVCNGTVQYPEAAQAADAAARTRT